MARGGWAASAAFLTRAAELSPDPATQARRLLAAARAETTAGAPEKAQVLLDRSLDRPGDRLQDGLAKRAQGMIYYALDQPAEAAAVLLAAASGLAAVDVHLARGALLDALTAARLSGALALSGATEIEIAAAAREMPLLAGQAPTIGDLLLDADAALLLDGHQAAAPLVRGVIGALENDRSESAEMLDWLEAGCRLAGVLGDDVALYALAGRLEAQARRQGAVTALGTALIYSGSSEMFAGFLDEAEARFTERRAIEVVRDYDCALGNLIMMAWRGHDSEARAGAVAVAAAARAHGEGWKLAWVEYSLCVLELSNGRYQEAVASTPAAFEENLLVSAFALADFIEAAVRCGNAAAAGQGLTRIADWAPAGGSPMALGLLARSRALLAGDQEAEAFYAEALDCLARCRGTMHLARTQLCTANGCGAASAAPRPGSTCELPTRASRTWARPVSPSGPG